MEVKWLTWAHVVDGAQILGALSTTAAVLVALWLALRAEKPKLVFLVEHTFNASTGKPLALILAISNVGPLPIHVGKVLFRYPHLWGATTESAFTWAGTHVLASGAENHYAVHFNKTAFQAMHYGWWLWNRPNFWVFDTRGVRYCVKVNRSHLRLLKNYIDFTE